MRKITVNIDDTSLSFKYRTNKPVQQNLLNTNVISNNELIFSDEYLQSNVKIVGLFLDDLAKEKNISNVIVSSGELCELIFPILEKMKVISCLTISNDENISYKLCEAIAKSKNIKKLNCYGIPTFMMELLDKNEVIVEARNEVLFTSNFMAENDLTSFSKMYYKQSVRINHIFGKNDLEDFKVFLDINKYLKTIHFEQYSLDNIKLISQVLMNARKKKISLQIHDDLNDGKQITELREINKNLKKNKLILSLVYSQDYIEKNYLQQIIFTTLKVCAFIIFSIVAAVFGYVLFNNYSSQKKVDDIKENIKAVLDDTSEENSSNTNESDENTDNINDNSNNEKIKFVKSYDKLLSLNEDTVGWLTVNNTNIDYPVVKSTDNSYYLEHNFYKEKDYSGWVFMDYRNSIDSLNDNTIIYAHNRYSSGVMFGTLTETTKKDWYTNESNLYITFDTLYETHKWKIFSIYAIDVTSDYLFTYFKDDNDRLEFYNMLKNRSDYEFDTNVTANDKILTLSTCLDNDRRLVVHAVLQT